MSHQDEDREFLANTWRLIASEPVRSGGFQISCPGCGSEQGLVFASFPENPGEVHAEHRCEDTTRYSRAVIRRWTEPRVTREYLRQHGQNTLAAFEEQMRQLKTTK